MSDRREEERREEIRREERRQEQRKEDERAEEASRQARETSRIAYEQSTAKARGLVRDGKMDLARSEYGLDPELSPQSGIFSDKEGLDISQQCFDVQDEIKQLIAQEFGGNETLTQDLFWPLVGLDLAAPSAIQQIARINDYLRTMQEYLSETDHKSQEIQAVRNSLATFQLRCQRWQHAH